MKNLKIEVKWALIFILSTLLWMVLERAVGLHDQYIGEHAIYTNLFAIVAITIFVFALLDKRKKSYGGVMTYQQGLVSGLIISAMVAAFSPLGQYITSTIITPDYFANIIRYSVENGLMEQKDAEEYFNLQSYIVQGVFGALVMGTVTSAIVALFTRKSTQPVL